MNPADKRLAVMVEDHPYDYKDFEGLIPKGNYGAGSVIIWDEGTYSLYGADKDDLQQTEKLTAQALEKGHLTLIFKGKKMHGEYSLVKLKNGENQWLIIKKADEYAAPTGITDERSARSGRTLEDVEGDKVDVPDDPPAAVKRPAKAIEDHEVLLSGKDLAGAVKHSMPAFVEPMLATLDEKPFDRYDWIFEVKWDGYRSIAIVKNGDVKLFSRAGKVYTGKFPAVAEGLKGLAVNAIFDGELAVLDKEGRSDFQMLQAYLMSRKGPLVYYVFDCLYAGSYDLRGLPLKRRIKILEKILPVSNTIRLSGYVDTDGKQFYEAAVKNGLEGIIAKNLNSSVPLGHALTGLDQNQSAETAGSRGMRFH